MVLWAASLWLAFGMSHVAHNSSFPPYTISLSANFT